MSAISLARFAPSLVPPRWVDRAIPVRLIVPLRNALIAITVFDSVATFVWLRVGVADEGNPIVAALIDTLGKGPALAVRAAFTAALVILLARVARTHWTARIAMLVALVVLGALSIWHASIMGAGYAYLVSTA